MENGEYGHPVCITGGVDRNLTSAKIHDRKDVEDETRTCSKLLKSTRDRRGYLSECSLLYSYD